MQGGAAQGERAARLYIPRGPLTSDGPVRTNPIGFTCTPVAHPSVARGPVKIAPKAKVKIAPLIFLSCRAQAPGEVGMFIPYATHPSAALAPELPAASTTKATIVEQSAVSPPAPARLRLCRKANSRLRSNERTDRTAVAAVEGDTAIIRPARAARPICHGLPRHPRAAALQGPGGQRGAGGREVPLGGWAGRPSGGCVGYGPDSRYDAALRYVKSWAKRGLMRCTNFQKDSGTHLHGTHVQWRSRPQHQ
jgi:hypothetical protein